MKTLYHVYLEDEDAGEIEGMFDDNGALLGTWCNNDANWRSEYFDGFMKSLGLNVKAPPKKLEAKLEKALREAWTQ